MAHSTPINRGTSRALAVIGDRVLDDAHMTWIGTEVESEHALHAWFAGAAPDRAAAYVAYRAALDPEEAAACDLQRLYALIRSYREPLARTQ
jgi:hypothetical protein